MDQILIGIQKFSAEKTLKSQETQEKGCLPSADIIKQEKNRAEILTGIQKFDYSEGKLNSQETLEKGCLPSAAMIKQEKSRAEMLNGIKQFDTGVMSKVETVEKIPLPTQDHIEQEKQHL